MGMLGYWVIGYWVLVNLGSGILGSGPWGSYRKRYGGRKNLRAARGIGRNLRRRAQFQEEEEREGKVER